jgi:transposase-like protein
MTSTLKSLRAAVVAGRAASGRLRSSARVEVGRLIADAHESGLSYTAIASALGVTDQTLKRWRAPARSTLAAVRIVDAPAPARALMVHGPSGLRIEGMSLDELAELLRRLA